jgi:hypothetical protein
MPDTRADNARGDQFVAVQVDARGLRIALYQALLSVAPQPKRVCRAPLVTRAR